MDSMLNPIFLLTYYPIVGNWKKTMRSNFENKSTKTRRLKKEQKELHFFYVYCVHAYCLFEQIEIEIGT